MKPLEDGLGAFRGLRSDRRSVTIHGIVTNHLGRLVPNAGLIVIRRLEDGANVGQANVDSLAKFMFLGFEPGTYAAELVDGSGRVIATSGALSAGAGAVIELSPVIPGQTGPLALLASATDGVLNSAISIGVMAISPGLNVSDR
jgi:hypothetical protein